MAQRGSKIVGDKLCCAICLDLLKEPVTIPCGHNYCMDCIRIQWDLEDQKQIHRCPQCRQTFVPRPALVKNTMLAELVEEHEKTGLQAVPADHCYAGPGDVACDVCTGRKLKAIKSCLQCLVSYCEQHLQPHYESAAFEKHTLVDSSKRLKENICSHHDEVMKIFCRTDQKCICYLCSIDQHKDHCIVSAATEKNEKQKELKPCREKLHQKIKDREEDVTVFQHRMEAINYSADEAVRDSEKIFSELMRLIEKRSSDIKQQIRSQQETEVNRTRELLQQVQQELSELKRKDAELEELSHTEDLIKFLHMFPLLSDICESTFHKAPRYTLPPLVYFENVMGAVSEMKDELQHILSDGWQKSSQTITNVRVFLPQAKPETTTDFLQLLDPLTLDSDSESEDRPAASQDIGLRTPPSAGLKKSCSRQAGVQEVEDLSISAETADPEHASCPPTFTRLPLTLLAPQAEPKTTFNQFQTARERMLGSDSESEDKPAASQDTRLRKRPSAGLKKSCSRQAVGQEKENLSTSAETADPEHAICLPTFTRPPRILLTPQAEPKTATNFLQFLKQFTRDSDNESVDRPAASQDTRLRKRPSAGLKKSCSRRAGGKEAEDLSISAETADREHANCPPPPTVLTPPILRRHPRITPPFFPPIRRDPVRTIPSATPPPTLIAPPIIAPPIIAPPIWEHHMYINDLPFRSEPVRTFNPSPPIMRTVTNPFLTPAPTSRSTIHRPNPRHY